MEPERHRAPLLTRYPFIEEKLSAGRREFAPGTVKRRKRDLVRRSDRAKSARGVTPLGVGRAIPAE